VALHDARIALADRGARDVHVLAGLEQVDLEFGARLEVGALALGEAELDELLAGNDARLGVMAGDRLREPEARRVPKVTWMAR
jgi:hypothetical protein